MSETPIFDAVLREQGLDEMPLPPMQTHEEFMQERAHGLWLEAAEMILKGVPNYYDNENDNPRDTKPTPIKKPRPRKKP